MESMGKVTDSLSIKYEHFNLIGDFNAIVFDTSVENFCVIYKYMYLIRAYLFQEPT